MSGARRGVVLDRDGTIIDFVRDEELGIVTPAFHPRQIRFLPGALEGMRWLAERGVTIAIATNQPGAAKGQIPRSAIEATNEALVARLRDEGIAIAKIEVCMHHPEGGPGGDPSLVMRCECRKPRPGMILSIVRELGLDPARTFMVGDAMTDVEAGVSAGVSTALVAEAGRCEVCPMKGSQRGAPDVVAARLDAIARAVVTLWGEADGGSIR